MAHNKLWKILQETGIPNNIICLLKNLYASQEATVRTGHGTTDWFQIRKGVCQGLYCHCAYLTSEKETVPHSSTLAWKIPWTGEPGRLQSMGSLSQTRLSDFTFTFHYHALEKDPLQCSCLENPRDGGAWWAAVYEGTQSQTRLKRLSNSSKAVYCHPAYLTDMQSTP